MLVPTASYWTTLINFIVQHYFTDAISTCIIWNKRFDFELQIQNINYNAYVNIWLHNLSEYFEKDVYDFAAKEQQFSERGVSFDVLVEKLTVAIEHSHCEAFVAFQEDIPLFAQVFNNASILSRWRSLRNKFLFAYTKQWQDMEYFDGSIFKDQPNIVIVETEMHNSSIFTLKTNKFVGSVHDKPETLYIVDHYKASEQNFALEATLYADKTKDLKGREIVLGAFDYRPQLVVDYSFMPQSRDLAEDNPRGTVHLNGVEVRYLLEFCEKYNCTVMGDTSEKGEWGYVYPNTTGYGLLGMIVDGKVQIGVGGMFMWDAVYAHLDMTAFIGRSGVRCLVPLPKRLPNWDLPLRPFSVALWMGICACLLVETVALLLTRHFEMIIMQKGSTWLSSFTFGYVTSLKLFISQNSQYVVESSSVRIILFSCYIIDTIVTSLYGGGLASVLSLPILAEPADSMYRLYTHDLLWTGTSEIWLRTIQGYKDDPITMRVVDNFRIITWDEMREMAKTENMGFVLERMQYGHFGNSEFITNEALDRLKLMTDDMYFQYTTSFVPRLWPLLKKYNDLIYACHSSGFPKIWEFDVSATYLSVHIQESIQASQYLTINTEADKLAIHDIFAVFLVWLIGMIASMTSFAVEILLHRGEQMRKQIKTKTTKEIKNYKKIAWSKK